MLRNDINVNIFLCCLKSSPTEVKRQVHHLYIMQQVTCTEPTKKYALALHFIMLCCRIVSNDLPIFFRFTSSALGQPLYWSKACEATIHNMSKYFKCVCLNDSITYPDSKVHGANMGPIQNKTKYKTVDILWDIIDMAVTGLCKTMDIPTGHTNHYALQLASYPKIHWGCR